MNDTMNDRTLYYSESASYGIFLPQGAFALCEEEPGNIYLIDSTSASDSATFLHYISVEFVPDVQPTIADVAKVLHERKMPAMMSVGFLFPEKLTRGSFYNNEFAPQSSVGYVLHEPMQRGVNRITVPPRAGMLMAKPWRGGVLVFTLRLLLGFNWGFFDRIAWGWDNVCSYPIDEYALRSLALSAAYFDEHEARR